MLIRYLVVVALLAMSLGLANAVQPSLAKDAPAVVDPARLDALQVQILEATRLIAEKSIEATRANADTAIAQIAKSADAAIAAAKESNETIKTIFQWGAGIVGLVVAACAFFGWREVASLRSDYDHRYKAAFEEFQKELSKAAKGVNEQVATVQSKVAQIADFTEQVTAMSIDIARIVLDMDELDRESDPAKRKARSDALIFSLSKLETQARKLGDDRTQGWIFSQRGLIHYHMKQYVEAYKSQAVAIEPRFNPMDWPDRFQNLAGFAVQVYLVDRSRIEMRKIAVDTVIATCTRMPNQALIWYKDEDIRLLFPILPDFQKDLYSLIPAMDKSGLPPP